MKTSAAYAAGLLLAVCLPATAQNSLNWDLTGSGGTGTIGNSRSFTTDGVTVRATAWSFTKGSADIAFEAARLGQWSGGLGVTNVQEDGSSPFHQVDNESHNDWILFVFDELVDVGSVRVQPYGGTFDRDVSYWVGTIDPGANLDGLTYSSLSGLGFGAETVVNNSSGTTAIDVVINAPATGVNAMLFGARRGVATGLGVDAFKVQSVCAVTAIPEPTSAVLGLLGVGALCLRRRR
jgi:MYXO-CTERM domain-containing protein